MRFNEEQHAMGAGEQGDEDADPEITQGVVNARGTGGKKEKQDCLTGVVEKAWGAGD